MTTSDDLLNGIRENELASAMVELTRSIQSLRGDTAASQAAGVRFDAKLLTSISKLADMAGGLRDGLGRIKSTEQTAAGAASHVAASEGRFAQLEQAVKQLSDDFKQANSGFDGLVKARVDIAYTALGKRIAEITTQINDLPRGGFKGDPGKVGKAGPPGPGLPKGGSEGQIPVKASDADFDIVWRSSEGGGAGERGAFTIWNAPASSGGTSANGLPVGGTAGQVLSKIDGTDYNTQWITGSGTGTVTTVSVVTANGVSGSVANATTTPAITLTLGAITPTTIVASGAVSGSNLSGTNTGDQTITLTGDVTGAGTGSFATTIAAGAVTLAKMANMASASLIYRKTAGSGAPEVNTLATLKTDLLLTGTNSGDQTITLTGDVTGSGTGSFAATIASNQKIAAIEFVIDGGGSAITTGMKGYLEIPFACTITAATTLADQSGSIVVDIFKCTYAQFDAGSTHPVSGDKITSSTPPTISTATKAQDTTLASWTTSISAGDILAFNVNSITTCQRVTVSLKVTKS